MVEFNIVTSKRGDFGFTSLIDGVIRYKYEKVFDVLGDIDELNSFLGISKAHLASEFSKATDTQNLQAANFIAYIQSKLINISSKIAGKDYEPINDDDVLKLENMEKQFMDKTIIKNEFVLPGSSMISAYLDVARSITRRVERRYIGYTRAGDNSLKFLNRLSDLLFVMARHYS